MKQKTKIENNKKETEQRKRKGKKKKKWPTSSEEPVFGKYGNGIDEQNRDYPVISNPKRGQPEFIFELAS